MTDSADILNACAKALTFCYLAVPDYGRTVRWPRSQVLEIGRNVIKGRHLHKRYANLIQNYYADDILMSLLAKCTLSFLTRFSPGETRESRAPTSCSLDPMTVPKKLNTYTCRDAGSNFKWGGHTGIYTGFSDWGSGKRVGECNFHV